MPLGPLRHHANRRWQVALGATALLASTALFFIARDSRSLAAPAPAALVTPAATITEPVIEPAPVHVVVAVEPAPVIVHSAPIAAKPDPAMASTHKRPHHAGGAPQAHPRTASFDPDGSVESY